MRRRIIIKINRKRKGPKNSIHGKIMYGDGGVILNFFDSNLSYQEKKMIAKEIENILAEYGYFIKEL